jgi:putative RecB family exonuclease
MIAVAPNGTDTKTRLEALTQEVSASRLNLWSSCRLKFYFRYVLQLSKPPTPALHLGKVVHSVLQQWNMARWRGEQLSSSAMIDLFVARWTDQEPGIDWDDKEDDLSKKASLMLKTYFEQTPIPADEKPHGVEVRLEADLSQHGLPTLIGILDLVRPGGTIVDFKSSAQTPDPVRVVHQTEIQLTCYGVLYRDATGRKEAGFELHHLVKQKVPKLITYPFPLVAHAEGPAVHIDDQRQVPTFLGQIEIELLARRAVGHIRQIGIDHRTAGNRRQRPSRRSLLRRRDSRHCQDDQHQDKKSRA